MSQIIVCVKRHEIFFPCRADRDPDGCHWTCALCGAICARVSFGMMQGFWRCRCGGELDIIVDGIHVDVQKLAYVPNWDAEELAECVNEPVAPRTAPALANMSDEDFMKSCGISAEEPHEPEGS